MKVTPTLLTFLGSLALSAALTPLVRLLARRGGFLAQPQRDRWHPDPIPVLGGYAIAAAFFAATLLSTPLQPLLPLLVGAGLMFGLGALDDLAHLSATTKLVAQTIIAAVVVFLMPPAHITGIAPVDGLLSLIWIVGITNAFNLLDNIDGLSAGIATIAGAFFLAALGPAGGMPLTLAVSAFIGASLGFLIFNARPASIFMGDSGSLFLGSFLGGAALLAAPGLKAGVVPAAAIPLFILLVPIFDTAFVSVTRRLAGRSPLLGGRDHLSHRLVTLGIDERRAVIGLYLLAALGGFIALSLQHADVGYAALLVALYLVLLAAIGIGTRPCRGACARCRSSGPSPRIRRGVPEPSLRGAARSRAPRAGLLCRVPLPVPGRGVQAFPAVLCHVISAGAGVPAWRTGPRGKVSAGLAQLRRTRDCRHPQGHRDRVRGIGAADAVHVRLRRLLAPRVRHRRSPADVPRRRKPPAHHLTGFGTCARGGAADGGS